MGSGKPWRLEASVERALQRAGHHTLLIDDRKLRRNLGVSLSQRWIKARAASFGADLIFLGKGQGLELDTAYQLFRGRRTVLWYQDAPYHSQSHRPEIAHLIDVGRMCDVFFVTGYAREWEALGLRARFLPAAADRDLIPTPPRAEFAAEVAFIGTGYDEERARFLVDLSAHVPVRVWGEHWERWTHALAWSGRRVDGADFAAACSSAKIVLGILPTIAANATDYASDRMWMTALAGGFYLGPRTHGADALLRDGVHCGLYDDFNSCVRKVHHYLRDANARERTRQAGEHFVRTRHTFDQRVPHLLSGKAFGMDVFDRAASA